MREGKFFSIKYTRRYIYANFGTFLGPPGISVFNSARVYCFHCIHNLVLVADLKRGEVGGDRSLLLTGCILKQVKILHKMHDFCITLKN